MTKRKVVSMILFSVSGICLVAGGVFLWQRHAVSRMDNPVVVMTESSPEPETADEESTQVTEESATKEEAKEQTISVSENQNESAAEEAEPEELPVLVENPYKDYFLRNQDMAAWIKIPDTVVDYPVMWTPEDEEYYLYRDFDRNSNKRGCLILDTDSNMYPLTTNLIIHGHNIPGAMFGELDRYEDKDYRDDHPLIYLYGRDYEHIYEVMAVFRSKVYYTTDVCFKFYKFFQADTEAEFLDFYKNVKALASYDSGVEASFGDRFLTLSTCAYHTENGRLVVVAKEIEPGDSYIPVEDPEKPEE